MTPAIRGTTRVYAVIGDPVAHSLSPVMQNAAFAACGIDAVYVALHVRPAALAAAVRGLAAASVAGFNVTVPHKEAVLSLVDVVRPRAAACGAINTVTRTARGWVGDNTDGDGFLAALADEKRAPRGARALVIGAGGSARSVVDALLRGGSTEVVIVNRTVARAESLAATLSSERRSGGRPLGSKPGRSRRAGHARAPAGHPNATRRRVLAGSLDLLRDAETLARCDLIVNCTTTGLAGADLPSIAFTATRNDVLCYDLVYGPQPSPFLRRAAAAGRRAVDGRGMLLHQGALAFSRWTGRPAPVEIMRRALARALRASRPR